MTSSSVTNSESDEPLGTVGLVTDFLLPIEDVQVDKDEGE